MKTQTALIELAKEKGIELTITAVIESGRQDVYWFDGVVASFKHIASNKSYDLFANGSVHGSLFNEKDDYTQKLDGQIKDDSELHSLIENKQKDTYPQLLLEENNWFEIFPDENVESEETFALESDNIFEAIEETIDFVLDIV